MTITIPSGRTLPLKAKIGGGFESAIEAGAPALTGGTSALSYSIAALSRDAEVTIATDGTYDFGSVGPEFVVLFDATLVDGSGNVTPILGPGSSVVKGRIPVQADSVTAKMPGGKALALEGYSTYEVNTVQHQRGFESRTYYWPQQHQDNAFSYISDQNNQITWQLKPLWNMSDFDFSGTDTDFFLVTWQRFYDSPSDTTKRWKNSTKLSSNSVPSQPESFGAPLLQSDSLRSPYDEPYTTEFLYDQGDVATTGQGRAEAETYSPVQGIHYSNFVETGLTLHEPTGPTKEINSFTYPGFLLDWDEAASGVANVYPFEGETYKAAGAGAACRVAITNNADYRLATKRTILEPVTGAWSSLQVKAKLRGGWWSLDALSGKYLCVIGADNTQIGSGVAL